MAPEVNEAEQWIVPPEAFCIPYSDLGADYFDQRDRGRIERHHIHRLEQLGYTVTLMPKEAA